ncbi:MAG: biosynthetic-type acetolactate synthase large subunit [Oscillospiraceae bacterium]|nr:biosynthetic-type acetolactate synthase large subunit [Oscillospiraceae bacterium]MBQ8978277.1 biosynthetic-type acetolactate synthase large subunit [Oscillospiraceae bacterium]
MISAAEAMVRCLEEEGVKTVFGYPGAAICPFYDKLYDSRIHHVLVRHEANAGHAASGYARINNAPGVCIATSGPGATNLLTAIATAYADSIPLVCITGQVSTDQIGCDVFQEVDITGAAEPFVKYSYLVKDAADIPRIFKEAFYLAGTGRKGPVLIDVPQDIQMKQIDFVYPSEIRMRTYKPAFKGNPLQIQRIRDAVNSSAKPLLCVGGGVFLSGAEHEIREFARKAQIPAVSTMMGLSVFPTDDPMYLGMIGMHGLRSANTAMNTCDTIVMIGARVGDRAVRSPSFLAEGKTIIHIDVDPAEIGKNISVDIPLVGDCREILTELGSMDYDNDHAAWLSEIREIKNAVSTNEETEGYINPKVFIRRLSDRLPDNTVCVADVGSNQIWTCNNFAFREGGRFLTTGGMGTMGYSVPCALGAKLADPGREVVAVCGDGSFQMQLMELATIVQENAAVKIIVMKNKRLGMVRELQTKSYDDRLIATDIGNYPDFVALARAYGIEADRVSTMAEAEEKIEKLVSSKTAYLLECNVYKLESTL